MASRSFFFSSSSVFSNFAINRPLLQRSSSASSRASLRLCSSSATVLSTVPTLSAVVRSSSASFRASSQGFPRARSLSSLPPRPRDLLSNLLLLRALLLPSLGSFSEFRMAVARGVSVLSSLSARGISVLSSFSEPSLRSSSPSYPLQPLSSEYRNPLDRPCSGLQ